MSFEAIGAVLHHSQATPGAKLILTIIANFDGDEGAWPSQETISRMANIGTRQVRKYLTELVNLGELDVWVHWGKTVNGSRPTNRYHITLECPENCDRSYNHKAELLDTSGGRIVHLRRNNTTGEAELYALQTYKEPIKNQ